jgi:hypothetical protein
MATSVSLKRAGLALAMMLSLAACGGGAVGSADSGEPTGSEARAMVAETAATAALPAAVGKPEESSASWLRWMSTGTDPVAAAPASDGAVAPGASPSASPATASSPLVSGSTLPPAPSATAPLESAAPSGPSANIASKPVEVAPAPTVQSPPVDSSSTAPTNDPTRAPAPVVGTLTPGGPSVASNLTLSTVSPIPPAADEAQVLFEGRKQITVGYYGVNAFYVPWNSRYAPPDDAYYSMNTWHGGWKWGASADSTEGKIIPELSRSEAFFRGSTGTMLQFMIRNYGKTSGWTDADYDFEDLDRWANYYRARGKKVNFLWYANIWFDNLQSYSGTTIPRISVARFRDALERVTRRVGDVVQYWEGPNEPDSVAVGSWSWYNTVGRMNKEQFAQTYRLASQIIKSIQPNAQIAGPHFSGIDNHIVNSLEAVFKASAAGGPDAGFGTGPGTTLADWVDVYANHGYLAANPTNLQLWIDNYRASLAAVRRGGMGGKPHFISEYMSFDGAWPNLTLSNGETDKWRWFERQAVAAAFDSAAFIHFTWSQPGDYYGDTSQASVRARRAWWNSVVQFMTEVPVARIVKTRANTIRVTRVDGKTLETGRAVPQ